MRATSRKGTSSKSANLRPQLIDSQLSVAKRSSDHAWPDRTSTNHPRTGRACLDRSHDQHSRTGRARPAGSHDQRSQTGSSGRSRSPQLAILKRDKSAYGGELRNTREGRSKARPLATKRTMHLVLRSTKAKGEWSFRHPRNRKRVTAVILRFARKNGVRVMSMANVGNHLHLHMKLGNRYAYARFIRAITGAIAQTVTGRTRWNPSQLKTSNQRPKAGDKQSGKVATLKFWDYRPFTRIVESWRAVLHLRDYVRINQLEGEGANRREARSWIEIEKHLRAEPD